MALRKKNNEEKNKPYLNFKFKIEFPLSISCKRSLEERFDEKRALEDTDKSKKLREFMFNLMGINKQEELMDDEDIFRKVNELKLLIYKKLGVTKSRKFSTIMSEKIEEYLNES